jgi:tRNA pseudouridine synthase 10
MRRQATAIVAAGPICDACLGRAFGMVGHGLENHERAAILRRDLGIAERSPQCRCWVCDGVFARVNAWAERAVERSWGIEFNTYLFGVRPSARLEALEAAFRERFPTGTEEPLKRALNRSLGKAFEALVGRGTVSFRHPDLTFTLDLQSQQMHLRVASLYLYGRYRKRVRGIPQTHWPCRSCRGSGCPACDGTGKQYPESVEELIAAAPLATARAEDARLHGAGREDIDARMLGSGRPFVLELLVPRQRHLDLEALTERINREAEGKVEVTTLQSATRQRVAAIKEAHAEKRYRAQVVFAQPIAAAALHEAAQGLLGIIEQRTPGRVAHRRADRVRPRRVHRIEVTPIDATRAELILDTDGGLYIKELISGDEGRTHPSLSAQLGVDARVDALDVLDVRLPPDALLGKPGAVS